MRYIGRAKTHATARKRYPPRASVASLEQKEQP